jgi:CheY-like chemotaxis protein
VETPLSVDAVLCDLEFGGTAEQLSTLAALKAVTGAAPLIALVGFPRLDDVSRLQSAGATAVVSKPFLTGDLLWQIEQLLPTKSQE